jgi:ribosomal protein S18 acetylase RimI-like enzyme
MGFEIKLLPKAQGKGIAEWALKKIIDMAISSKKIDSVWATPNKNNEKARNLYVKLGLKEKEFPMYLAEENSGYHTYMELKLNEYKNPTNFA